MTFVTPPPPARSIRLTLDAIHLPLVIIFPFQPQSSKTAILSWLVPNSNTAFMTNA